MDDQVVKLEILFAKKYTDFMEQGPTAHDVNENWIDWCDQHKVRIMDPTEVIECWNDPGVKGICIEGPEESPEACGGWLLVPRTFAKKALVLNGLP